MFVPSETFEVAVQGTAYQVRNISVYRNNDTLYITEVNKNGRRKSPARVEIRVKDLALLDVTGNTSVYASGYINTDILSIHCERRRHRQPGCSRAAGSKPVYSDAARSASPEPRATLPVPPVKCKLLDVSGLDVVCVSPRTLIPPGNPDNLFSQV